MTPDAALDEELSTVFALLSDESRVAIVRELRLAEEPLTFGELCSRVGVRDSGRFNYHLGRLRGVVVEKTADGYVLTDLGERLVATAGALSATATEP